MHYCKILNNISLNYFPEDVKSALDNIQQNIISPDIILVSIRLYALSVDLPKSKKVYWAFYMIFFNKFIFIMSIIF